MNLNIYKLFFAISLGLLIGCSPEDPIESDITNYAVFQMEGKQYSLHQLGEDYVDPGVIATEDGNEIEVEVTGEVDSNTPGLYILTYSATNTDGYSASTVRYVGVGDKETATNRDLTGEYLSGNGGENEVSKFADGYYTNSDALPPNEIGIYMIDLGNGSIVFPTQSSDFGPIIGDPNIVPGTGGSVNSDTSFFLGPRYSRRCIWSNIH